MQTYQPGWPPMAGPPPQTRRRRRWIYAAAILLGCWMLGLTSSPAGLAAIGLMFAVVYQISRSLDRRGALLLSALVGLTTGLVMAHAHITPKIDIPARPTSQSVEELRQSVIDGWQSFATGFTTPPDEGRRR